MFCSLWIASWENLTNVLTLVTTMKTCGLWGPVVNGSIGPDCTANSTTDYSHNGNILHYSRLWCTILQVLPNQSYTIAYMYSSLTEAMSLRLTNNRTTVPMEETLLHKLQATESRSRYLQIPDCYKLCNGRFDVTSILFPHTRAELHWYNVQ